MGAWWDGEKTLWLVTPDEFARLPNGFVLTAIDGEKVVKGKDWIDDDVRFGHMAYGASKEEIDAALTTPPAPSPWRPDALVAAANALIDFHNGPVEAKRPDIFQRLMQRLADVTPPQTEPRT